MAKFDSQRRITAAEAMAQLPGPKGQRFVELFTHGSLGIEFYAPRGHDPQQPHTRDEAYILITTLVICSLQVAICSQQRSCVDLQH